MAGLGAVYVCMECAGMYTSSVYSTVNISYDQGRLRTFALQKDKAA